MRRRDDSLSRGSRALAPWALSVAAVPLLCGCSYFGDPVPFVDVIGRSVRGRSILITDFGLGPETVLLIATIHGNEPAGTPLLRELTERLCETPDLLAGRRVLIVPVVNPDGLAANDRRNARGVDLNRNFDAPNREASAVSGHEALSEPEARSLAWIIERERPVRVLSIHQPLACVDWDGPADELAAAVAAAGPLPARKLGARPGSLGAWVGEELGIPILTLELRREDSRLSAGELWSRYGRSLLAFIAWSDEPAREPRLSDARR